MRLEWGQGPRNYEGGLNRGVIYTPDGAVPWNGLVSVDEDPNGEIDTSFYFDGVRTAVNSRSTNFSGQISAYTYPKELEEFDPYLKQRVESPFGLVYSTGYGEGYRLHIIYNAYLRPTAKVLSTNGASPSLALFSWDIRSSAIPVAGILPTSHFVLESQEVDWQIRAIEDALYGTATTDPRLPRPEEIIEIYEYASRLIITNNFDGTYTAEGEDELVTLYPDGSFIINASSAQEKALGEFIVSSTR